MPDSLSVIVKNDPAELPRLAEIVSDFCGRNRLAAPFEQDLNLALEEAVINVMMHGYADRAEHDIAVILRLDPAGITVCVEDDGLPFNPLEAPPPNVNAPIGERRAGGLGIHMVRRLMDQLEYQRLGNKNILVMRKQCG